MEMSEKEKPLTREDVQGMIDAALEDFAKRGEMRRMKDNDQLKSNTPESQKTMTLRDRLRAWFVKMGSYVPFLGGKDQPQTETPESKKPMSTGDKLRASFERQGMNVPHYPGHIVKKLF